MPVWTFALFQSKSASLAFPQSALADIDSPKEMTDRNNILLINFIIFFSYFIKKNKTKSCLYSNKVDHFLIDCSNEKTTLVE
jgi:hypothetical protein